MIHHMYLPMYIFKQSVEARAEYEEMTNLGVPSEEPEPIKEVTEVSIDPRTIAFKYNNKGVDGSIIVLVSGHTMTSPLSIRDIDKIIDAFYTDQDLFTVEQA